MSTITVPMPDEDLAFLRAYSEAHGLSPEAFLAQQARNLRAHLQSPLHADVVRATGIVEAEIDGPQAHRRHLAQRHG